MQAYWGFFGIRKREKWGKEKEEQNRRERVSKQEMIETCDRKSLQVLNFSVCKFRVEKGFDNNICMHVTTSKTAQQAS